MGLSSASCRASAGSPARRCCCPSPSTWTRTPPSRCCSGSAPSPPPATPSRRSCSACPARRPRRRRCSTASRWPSKGEAGRALGAAYMASLIGGLFGALLLGVCHADPAADHALSSARPSCWRSPSSASRWWRSLSGNAPLRGLAAACFGIMLAMIGSDPQTGTLRWTLDSLYLWDGLPLVPVALGLFALPELCDLAIKRTAIAARYQDRRQDRHAAGRQGRASATGCWSCAARWIGAGAWRDSGHRRLGDRLGRLRPCAAHREGRAADLRHGRRARRDRAESANNAKEGGALVPTIAFGVPGSAGMAILLGAFLIHGLVPGPGHADQEPRRHLFDGLEHRARQHPRRRTLLRVQRPVRQARDAALHADPAGRPEPRSTSAPSRARATGATSTRCWSSACSAGS